TEVPCDIAFFFFQAEDGIRDFHVTGVQTCALPIYIATLLDDAILAVERDNPKLKQKLPRDYARRGIAPEKMKSLIDLIANIGFRSEERRVGKECRAQWCARPLTNKTVSNQEQSRGD